MIHNLQCSYTSHDDLPEPEANLIDAGLEASNLAAAPLHEAQLLACFARLENGTAIGGVVGRTWGDHVTFVVFLFADTVMLTLLYLTPLPVFSIMGGVRLSDSERVLREISFLAGVLGTITWPFWLITALVAIANHRFQPYVPQENLEKPATGISAWLLGVAALLVWIPILPMTQPEQQLRRDVEQDLRGGRIDRALTTMSEHDRVDFPPHWDPPPRIGYGETSPSIIDVLEIAVKSDVAAWVLEVFQQKFEDSMGTDYHSYYLWNELANEEFERYLNLIEQLPPSPEFLKANQEALRSQISDDDVGRTEEQRTRLHQLLDEAARRESLGNDVVNEDFN